MGLIDRDYMREREERPATRPRMPLRLPRGAPLALPRSFAGWLVLTLACAVALAVVTAFNTDWVLAHAWHLLIGLGIAGCAIQFWGVSREARDRRRYSELFRSMGSRAASTRRPHDKD